MKDCPHCRAQAHYHRARLLVAGMLIPVLMLGLFAIFNAKATAQMFTIVSCTSSSPCTGGNNKSTGSGVYGVSSKGYGVQGKTPTTSYLDAAIFGQATNNAYGVEGSSVNNSAVYGTTTNGIGVEGISNTATGVYGQGGSFGLYASTPTGGIAGLYVLGASNDGGQIFSSTGRGLFVQNGCNNNACGETNPVIEASSLGNGEGVDSFTGGELAGRFENNGASPQGDGVEMYGQYIGLISRAPASGGYPEVLTDLNNNDLFFVDGSGNVFYHGGLFNFLRTRDGNVAKSYGAVSTVPSVEDSGTARLSGGVAQVAFNPAFARSIDGQAQYQVMLTPDGDTRGLYVAQKGSAGFVVRELQGGRSSISFDYHIYATKLGYARERMTEMTPAFVRAMEPRSAVKRVTVRPQQPIKITLHK